MKKIVNIGLDIGNYDTKTQSVSIPSGFTKYRILPYDTKQYIKFGDNYYVPDYRRFPYERDKTVNENLYILSLLGIGMELVAQATRISCQKQKLYEKDKTIRVLSVQEELDIVKGINLGIGLPLTHIHSLSEKTIEYYKNHFNVPINFICNGYSININLNKIKCYPQDISAIVLFKPTKKNEAVEEFSTYYAIDIGGWTVDVATVIEGQYNEDQSDSLPLGMLSMTDKVIHDIEIKYGERLTQNDVEIIIRRNKRIYISDEIREDIEKIRIAWYERIINSLEQLNLRFNRYPTIFIGGGSLMLKDLIENDNTFAHKDFINSPNANAKAYAAMIGFKEN